MLTPQEKGHLQNFKQGDLASFNWLYRNHYKNVYHFCLSFTKSPVDAEEITADVFVTMWKKREMIDASQPVRPLLFKITKDLTWNFLRKVSTNRTKRDQYIQNYEDHSGLSADAQLLYDECENSLMQAIRKLTPQQQQIFTLRYFQGKNLNQIAEELAISKNTVKVHLAKAKQFLLVHIPSLSTFQMVCLVYLV